MRGPAVVDSSVAYKWLHALGEHHVDEAVDLMRDQLEGRVALLAPSTMPAELVNALRCKASLTPADVTELIKDLETIDVTLMDVTYARLDAATELSYRHKLSVYDALFLALAEETRLPARDSRPSSVRRHRLLRRDPPAVALRRHTLTSPRARR